MIGNKTIEENMPVEMKTEIGHQDYIAKLEITKKRPLRTSHAQTRNKLTHKTTGGNKFTMPKYN